MLREGFDHEVWQAAGLMESARAMIAASRTPHGAAERILKVLKASLPESWSKSLETPNPLTAQESNPVTSPVSPTVASSDQAAKWRAAMQAAKVRDAEFTSLSGTELQPVYGPGDVQLDPDTDLGYPGQYPLHPRCPPQHVPGPAVDHASIRWLWHGS